MIRSLSTGVSGIRMNQMRMDVIGNNIANVNTVGFKQGRANFSELLGQKMMGNSGGNPSYIGLGVDISSVDQNWNQGALQYTNVATDLALAGDGFFVVEGEEASYLTRAGNFSFNGDGEFVTADGLKVQGWAFDDDGNVTAGATDSIKIGKNLTAAPNVSANIAIGGNLSTDAEVGAMNSISTNVYDEQGRAHAAVIEFTKTDANEWSYEVSYQGDLTPAPFATTTGTLDFDVDGALVDDTPIDVAWDTAYESSGANMSFDFAGLTQYAGSTTSTVRSQDGFGPGELLGYTIDGEGVVNLSFSNGTQKKAFQLAVGTVNNPNGLEQKGSNLYSVTSAAGDVTTGRIGQEIQSSIRSGALEMSNVDLASEFTDMIVTQRGYQAAARIITTSDELLQEVVQLKR